MKSECDSEVTIVGIVSGILLIIGTIISCLPQVIQEKTSEGVNMVSLILSNLSSWLLFVNGVVLQWHAIQCCSFMVIFLGNDLNFLTGCVVMHNPLTFRLFIVCKFFYELPSISFFTEKFLIFLTKKTFIICIIYYPLDGTEKRSKEKLLSWVSYGVFTLFMGISLCVPLLVGGRYGFDTNGTRNVQSVLSFFSGIRGYAYACSTVSSILVGVLWWPQIYTTYKLKSPGSLSLIKLGMQTPGAFLFVIFIGLLSHNNFTTWLPPLVSGVDQVILFAMCIYYTVLENRRKVNKEESQSLIVNAENT